MSKDRFHPEIKAAAPGCFSAGEWAQWCRSERSLANFGIGGGEAGFCAACTARYKHRMMREGKCRHENVLFLPDEDGDPIGVRPNIAPVLWYDHNSTTEEA